MARNKYPEETVEKILSASMRLFLEKGYENTTLQDIIDQLGGLTKGAIYHHFKGKEEILLAITDRLGEETERRMAAIRDDPTRNGLEKLREMFWASLRNADQTQMFSVAPNLLNNPRFLAISLRDVMETVVPKYAAPVLREGVRDGSIHTDYPEEVGEAALLLSNIWINPLIYPAEPEKMRRRIAFYGEILAAMGIDVLDDEMRAALAHYCSVSQGRL